MALGEYEVEIRPGVKGNVQLSDEEAERLGVKKVGDVETTDPEPVGRPPYAEDVEDDKLVTSKSAKHTANKARTSTWDKSADTK